MTCPECGGPVRVDSTLNMDGNKVYRRRQCKKCKFVFGTIEYITRMQDQFNKDWYIRKNRNKNYKNNFKGEKK